MHKAKGMVRDVPHAQHARAAGQYRPGPGALPHGRQCRPARKRPSRLRECPFGIVMVHNGNLTNARAAPRAARPTTATPTPRAIPVLLNVLAHELARASSGVAAATDRMFCRRARVHQAHQGSYAVIALIAGLRPAGVRDPHGIRPLCMGRGSDGTVMLASESVALRAPAIAGARHCPGRGGISRLDGGASNASSAREPAALPCMCSSTCTWRGPDSVLDGISVYQARLNMGETLAKRVISTVPPGEIDAIIPILESSRPSAMQLAQLLGIPYREGFVKNRYVAAPSSCRARRAKSRCARSSTPSPASSRARVLLVDDSIVRGTTSKRLCRWRATRARSRCIWPRRAPPVRYPTFTASTCPPSAELVAHGRTVEEIRQVIGADALIYQDVAGHEAGRGQRSILAVQGFEASCFDGCYITGDISAR